MSASAYKKILLAARRQQLVRTEATSKRLEQVYIRAAESICRKLAGAPEGSLTEEFLRNLRADINRELIALGMETRKAVDLGMLELAQVAAEREAKIGKLLDAPDDPRLKPRLSRTERMATGRVEVRFGTLAQSAVETIANRIYQNDGLKLSDRLYNLNQATRQTIEDTLVQGVAEQTSAKKLAKQLEASLIEAGADNPRYQALRIARTEINNAHREAHIRSTQRADGTLKPYIAGVRWSLSPSHPRPDICDIWASHDGDDLGSGVYLPAHVPTGHPHCLCYTSSVLVAYPDIGLSGKAADVESVSDAHLRYYADKMDDPTATAALAKRKEREP